MRRTLTKPDHLQATDSSPWRRMGRACGVGPATMVAVILAGCAGTGRVHVTTLQAPDATFATQRTFRFLPVPESRARQPDAALSDNPMLENSISGREVRHDITEALTGRGYVHQRETADLAVAYYIGSRSELVVSNYDYGYQFSDPKIPDTWRQPPPPAGGEYTYQQGTVIIDVLDSAAKHILWRGVGRTDVPADARDYAHALATAVVAIINQFPGRAPAEPATTSR
jgi:hypothetical protein